MRVYMRSSHQTVSPLEEFGVRLSLFSQYVPVTSESKYSRRATETASSLKHSPFVNTGISVHTQMRTVIACTWMVAEGVDKGQQL